MQVMSCWPSAWIAAAKKADLAFGMNAETGQFFIRGGDAMRVALEVFAQEIQAAECDRWRPVLCEVLAEAEGWLDEARGCKPNELMEYSGWADHARHLISDA